MTTTNPLSFLGGMVLEIGAVIALLVVLVPGGSRPYQPQHSPEPSALLPSANSVFYSAQPARVEFRPSLAELPSEERRLRIARSILPSTPCDVTSLPPGNPRPTQYVAEPALRAQLLPSYDSRPVEWRTAVRTGTLLDGRY